MWITFYQNILATIRQWFESFYFEPAAKPIKVRINQSATPVRQRQRHYSYDEYK